MSSFDQRLAYGADGGYGEPYADEQDDDSMNFGVTTEDREAHERLLAWLRERRETEAKRG